MVERCAPFTKTVYEMTWKVSMILLRTKTKRHLAKLDVKEDPSFTHGCACPHLHAEERGESCSDFLLDKSDVRLSHQQP
jgi:hypothetical protein